ncbi:MAG: isoaspartyl peptidase/L-asparaginase [Chloroflexi bacterium]|nr:isoaspartyl peptidase/L-asparaginase [Chloroflexota bacterium]
MPLTLIVHGGASDIPENEVEPRRLAVHAAAEIGWKVLANGGSTLDAVEAAIASMEDDPALNAGTGSSLNREGEIEMDASFMDGRTLDAGAVAGVRRVKHPIRLARRVLESEHTLLIGNGADAFAAECGIPLVDNSEMFTPATLAKWKEASAHPPSGQYMPHGTISGGTVGCVAVDRAGNVAAGTSTGGLSFKRVGRVGDSPIIGSGVYADNLLGGASSTGWGESIMRVVLAKYAVDALASDAEPKPVAQKAIEYLARRVGGSGGIIIADRSGRIGFAYNTTHMAHAYVREGLSDVVSGC